MKRMVTYGSAALFFFVCLALLTGLTAAFPALSAPDTSRPHHDPFLSPQDNQGDIAGGGTRAQSGVKSWEFERFDSDITVHEDGSFTVRETQVVNFTGSFTFLTRNVSTQEAYFDEGRTYGKVRVKDVEVFNLDGTPYDSSLWEADSYTGGELIRIRFQAQDEQRGWIISYRMMGAMIYAEDYDRLYWNAISFDRAVPVKSSRITVTLPRKTAMDEVEFTNYYVPFLPESTLDSGRDGEVIWWEARNIQPYTDFTIDIAFPKGTIKKPWPYRTSTLLLMFGLALAIFLTAVLVMLILWGWKGRDPYSGSPPGVSYAPPRELKPALMSMLVHQKPKPDDMMATVVDLAVRGKLKIVEEKAGEFSFERKDTSREGLLAYESGVMKKMFKKGEDRVDGDKVKLGGHLMSFLGDVRAEVKKSKFFYDDPEKTIGRYFRWAMALLLLPPVLLLVLRFRFDLGYVWVLLAGTVSAGIAMWAIRHAMPKRTPLGSRLYWQAMGFREYLETAEAGEAESMTLQNFQENLPYAMVLGMADRWAEMFAGILTTSPEWYTGPGGFNTLGFASSMRSMGRVLMVSTPPPSSGRGGSGFGGGFSGGGFGGGSSGGGFGGGGSSAG